MSTLILLTIKKMYEQLVDEVRDGRFVDYALARIADAWYEVLFNSQFNTDIELYEYFVKSDMDVDVEVFKRGWSWYGRC